MRDISLHILDLAMNCIRANATLIEIELIEQIKANRLIMKIRDNGCGMSEEMVQQARDPFFTTRTTRKVGLGLSLLTAMANRCEGDVLIESQLGVGTTITMDIQLNHIDRPPFGDIHNTIISLIFLEPMRDFCYKHQTDEQAYCFETKLIKQVIGDIPLTNVDIVNWMKKELETGDVSFVSY